MCVLFKFNWALSVTVVFSFGPWNCPNNFNSKQRTITTLFQVNHMSNIVLAIWIHVDSLGTLVCQSNPIKDFIEDLLFDKLFRATTNRASKSHITYLVMVQYQGCIKGTIDYALIMPINLHDLDRVYTSSVCNVANIKSQYADDITLFMRCKTTKPTSEIY